MNINNKKAHEIIKRAVQAKSISKLCSASDEILEYISVIRARDIIEDEIDSENALECFTESWVGVKLLDIITHKYKIKTLGGLKFVLPSVGCRVNTVKINHCRD